MSDKDWKEILSLSQRELTQADKEKLCENLSWMDSDDIEINFTDFKILFRLIQDILKYKSEQVNDLVGQLETTTTLSCKSKTRKTSKEVPIETDYSSDVNQKVIRTNKEILEQLQSDIAELKEQKIRLQQDISNADRGSDSSSRATFSEINAIMQLENEITLKNKHIRKLLNDFKVLEEENSKLKEKVILLKDKLTDATKLIDNLTEQVLRVNTEYTQLKETLAQSEQAKAHLSITSETLKNELLEKKLHTENMCENIKSKVQHWKNVARTKKNEIETLSAENKKLKEDLNNISTFSKSHKSDTTSETNIKIKELQEKLSEASKEIEQSANLINILRSDNIRLKNILNEIPDSSSEIRNESDDGKERTIITKLKKKVRSLTASLQSADEMIATREQQLAEITTQQHLLHSEEGMNSLLDGLKNKKRQLKLKDEGIKNLVHEVNGLSQELNGVQLENETLRQRFNIPVDEKISTSGIQRHYRDLERRNINMSKELRTLENKLISLELNNRTMRTKLSQMTKALKTFGYSHGKIEVASIDISDKSKYVEDGTLSHDIQKNDDKNVGKCNMESEMQVIIEENEGLRKGLQEISEFLKDNSTTSSGVLTLQCPSLEAVLRCMDARHISGWFAPHMATAMELRTALGGKDALLTALHEARMETYDVINQLGNESKKYLQLEQKLKEIENRSKPIIQDHISMENICFDEFGNWVTDREINSIDIYDENQIKTNIAKGDIFYEKGITKGLEYFHIQFKTLYDKMTSLAIEAVDNQNKWSITEEQYKAQLTNIKGQLEERDDDSSDMSPGIIPFTKNAELQRKCLYIEEIYKYIRTLYENMKNDNLELRKEIMEITSEYETKIQNLIISLVSLTDKLRSSISIELFWKQNRALSEINLKYRKALEESLGRNNSIELDKCMTTSGIEILSDFQKLLNENDKLSNDDISKLLNKLKQYTLEPRMQPACSELLEDKDKKIDLLEKTNVKLQEIQAKIIDESLASVTKQDVELMKEQLNTLAVENKIIKEQNIHVSNRLEIALLQLHDNQKRQMNNDVEVNLLRHQIIDLQSSGDNKAVVARLSNEVLVAHLQASECHNKIEKLTSRLNKEKELRTEAENMLKARQNIFEIYIYRHQSKFKYMYDILQIMREQYQGSLPIICVENYLNKLEDLSRKSHAVNEQLTEIEDLRSGLMIKHSVFDQILDVTKNKCLVDEGSCPHMFQFMVMQKTHIREIEHLNNKIEEAERSRKELIKQCNNLEKHLILINQGFEKSSDNLTEHIKKINENREANLRLEDVQVPEKDSNSRRSQTITLSKAEILKPELKEEVYIAEVHKNNLGKDVAYFSIGTQYCPKLMSVTNVHTQTIPFKLQTHDKTLQTDEDTILRNVKLCLDDLKKENESNYRDLNEALCINKKRAQEVLVLNTKNSSLESKIRDLHDSNKEKDELIERLRISIDELKKHINDITISQIKEKTQLKDKVNEENKSLFKALKQFDHDKNSIADEYKELLNNERDEYSKSIQELNVKIVELQTKLDRRGSDSNATNTETLKDIISKYTMKITELEEKCFNLQSELDECKSELTTYQSEADRWKDLASERLSKMEQLNSQLEERHCHEVESYKAENQHWLSQLNDTQKEHMELRNRLTEQKALYIKQLADKDVHIEQLRTIVHNLKTQVLNMQTMISVNDPSFDLSAIVEVDEASDALSQNDSDRLELKLDSTIDMNEDDILRIPGSSTTIWQETIIERLRREKQLAGKQNTILRRQIKALAARERRTRLDAQNLKNQIFRISTSSSKVTTAETTALQNKIASLQAQLMNARRDTQSNVALWDKWKRAQQSAERWQSRYEEKCQEIKRSETSLNLAKTAVTRLEREKRVLLSRLSETKSENRLTIDKQDEEPSEKSHRSITDTNIFLEREELSIPFVSTHALLQRVQAQQHRIAALELAEKGNEHLVSEYERCLAEITLLKGQVLKLESTLLESQIRTPIKKTDDPQPELDYWKGYCEMLKDENVQLTLKINSMETMPTTTTHQHRVNDLEQTVLTLRGLVSKLQSDQKSSGIHKRIDFNQKPNSGRSINEKNRTPLESYRIEIANLKRSIQDKDLLLERSKEMLKIAAEREDELLRENANLRRRIDDLTKPKKGFLSA